MSFNKYFLKNSDDEARDATWKKTSLDRQDPHENGAGSALDIHAFDVILDDPNDLFQYGLSGTMCMHVEIRKRNYRMHK